VPGVVGGSSCGRFAEDLRLDPRDICTLLLEEDMAHRVAFHGYLLWTVLDLLGYL
jgi:hypothetical protein